MFIVDVGASQGSFSKHVLSVYENSLVHAIEPNTLLCKQHLMDISQKFKSRFYYHDFALSKKNGKSKLYGYKIMGGQIGSIKLFNRYKIWDDYLNRNLNRADFQDYLPIRKISVNDFIIKNKIKIIDFLKIDTQGSDLEILELFLVYAQVRCLVLEVNTTSHKSENIYISDNTLENLATIISRFKLKIIKIIPNFDLTELNVFLAYNSAEALKIIECLKLSECEAFKRNWNTVVLDKEDIRYRNLLLNFIKKIIRNLKHPLILAKKLSNRVKY